MNETDDVSNSDELNCSSNEASQDIQIEQSEESFLQGKTVNEYFKNVMTLIKQCQKCGVDLQGWKNYADYPAVNKAMSSVTRQLYNLISKVFNHQDIKLNLEGLKLADQFDVIKEGNDALTERINSNIDEACGLRRDNDVEIADTSIRTIRGPVNQETGREVVLRASRNVQKPQMFFNPKINNSEHEPFIPLIVEKPNSIKPISILLCVDSDGREYYSNPYQYELEHWNPPEELLLKNDPIEPLEISQTPFLLVENEENLHILVNELKQEKEIAVDVEHHSFRTYQGLTCLIQISSRKKDYIIDPFPLRNQLPLLNEVFTDPKITKVFHGANQDILWLQRDCGVYVVNLFDTHQAAVVLEYPQRSLSHLLHKFCSLNANKTYQRADWRMRPLPEDFVYYARQDTHYLLYIYDILKNNLIENGNELKNLLCSVFSRSTELCLQRYEKPIIGPDSYMDVYRKSKKIFNSHQLYALQQIYLWRDKLARLHDESVDYILPKHMMLQMAEILPKEIQGILACCNPVPTYVKTEQLTLLQIIREAREIPLEKINFEPEHAKTDSVHQYFNSSDLMTSIVCRFDLSHVEEESKGLSTLLKPQETLFGELFNQNNFYDELEKLSEFWKMEPSYRNMRIRLKKVAKEYMSPFERYSISYEQSKILKQKKSEEDLKVVTEVNAREKKRIENVKEHFMSLYGKKSKTKSKEQQDESEVHSGDPTFQPKVETSRDCEADISPSTPTPSTSKATSDKERMERLQRHIASLTSDIRQTVSKITNNSTQNNQVPPKTSSQNNNHGPSGVTLNKRLRRLKNSVNKNGKKPSNPLKRRSEDGGSNDDEIKKLKPDEGEAEENSTTENTTSVSVKPFDYSTADISIFKSKKSKNFKGQGIKQKFKQNKNKSGVFRNNSKSLSWTNKG